MEILFDDPLLSVSGQVYEQASGMLQAFLWVTSDLTWSKHTEAVETLDMTHWWSTNHTARLICQATYNTKAGVFQLV